MPCRQVQDEFAAASHRKAAAAQAAGKFQAEIVPVTTKVKDPKTGNEQQVRGRRQGRFGLLQLLLGLVRVLKCCTSVLALLCLFKP